MTTVDRSPEAVEAERRELERLKLNRSPVVRKPKARNQAQSERFTTPAQALAELRASMRSKPGGPERLYKCGVCLDRGWEELSAEGRGTYRKCRRGCEVPSMHPERKSESGPKGAVTIS